MSLKLEFVERAEKGETMSTLCREFGISRTTGHKWVKRFRERGFEGLDEESRRPKGSPLAAAEDVVLAVLDARDAHPRWGPKKLEVLLKRRFGEQCPSERTIARVLKRANRVQERRRLRPANVVERAPRVQAVGPNDVWTVDFKGWWRAKDGSRCEPLTVRDAFSRFLFTVTLCTAHAVVVRRVFERLFRRYGLPRQIQCDNGVPFVAVRSRGGLSQLSAWWVSLGIKLVRSRPGAPQDNGGHERMHRDMRAEIEASPERNLQAQQRRLDRWRQEFNHVRPHQALGGKTPAEVYKPKELRRLGGPLPRFPPGLESSKVYKNGNVRYRGTTYFVSESLAGMEVALEPVDDFHVRIWFYDLDLGVIEVEPDVDDSIFLEARKRRVERSTTRAA
ncbi:MAG: IS481 family transposase [Myxococcales bacterium]|nr:IS481 family transposase [Myxococcales bacterium]